MSIFSVCTDNLFRSALAEPAIYKDDKGLQSIINVVPVSQLILNGQGWNYQLPENTRTFQIKKSSVAVKIGHSIIHNSVEYTIDGITADDQSVITVSVK